MNAKLANKFAITALAAALAACGGGGGGDDEINVGATCPTTLGNLDVVELGENQCQVSGVLTEDATLTATETWFLEGALQVGDVDNAVTLSVEPGTDILGDNVDMTDYLLVHPGSALDTQGTSAEPVRFLSEDEDVDGSGEWGGVFLRGFNGISLTGDQGANDLDYTVVSEAGAPVSVTIDGVTVNYQDNIVINGVDSSTTLSFVQSHNSARDGFHILNGDPRMSWLLATGSGRDGVWYRDFNGLIKDLMVIHNPDADSTSGRAGIYASETAEGNSNPRIVNATLVGRDSSSESAVGDLSANEFGILFADNSDQIRMGNVVIANFRNGCFEADEGADLSGIDSDVPGPTYLDGVHCLNEQGANPTFGVVRDGSVGFPEGVIAANNSVNANGFIYYNGVANPVAFTGEFADRTDNFTASWYLDNIGGIGNGLAGDSTFLNAFLDGDTNQDDVLNGDDNGNSFIISDTPFNQDVDFPNTGGYDLTHIGAVRAGGLNLPNNTQFDGWTVATQSGEGFLVEVNEDLIGLSECPIDLGGATVTALERSAGRDVCEISGVMTSDASIGRSIEWELEGRLQVGTDASPATLTIGAGTRVRGDNEDVVDYLLVWPGSALVTEGSSSAPVRFSSDDNGIDGTAEWGGVFLRGFNGLPTLTGEQGANDLDYTVVSEAGAPVSVTIDGVTANYQDNIVLNGVDSSTTLAFVQSHNSARDGFHILNGDPRMSWLLSTGAQRDGVWYRDFTGLIKDLMVIHNPDSGRSGIYASETAEGNSNPRIVNATLVGRDNASVSAGPTDNEFGILFADNTDQIRMANVLIANFRNGCALAESGADLSEIDTTIPGPNYFDGVHCANEAGGNQNFFVVREGSIGFPAETIAPIGSNGDGLVYYNGASGSPVAVANTDFFANAGGINFTGEIANRRSNFTAGWYVNNILGISNGLNGAPEALNGFLDGDTNNDGFVNSEDLNSPFIISDAPFNQDVDFPNTFGYDMTHNGAVRGGAVTNQQFDNWTVETFRSSDFIVRLAQ